MGMRGGTGIGGDGVTHVEHGFGPVWDGESRILVLGSMPSPKSRDAAFYYMHPRNRFWPLMAAVFEDDPGVTPQSRRVFALRHHVALWDVVASCDIVGASDASIRNVEANDPEPLLRRAPIVRIVTTGAKAAQLYRRLIEPRLTEAGLAVPMTPLPSTSPANAAMSFDRLLDAYRPTFRSVVSGE